MANRQEAFCDVTDLDELLAQVRACQACADVLPRPECAPLWRERLLGQMPELQLTLLVGTYAQTYALGPGTMNQRVKNFTNYLPKLFPLPHPSWRSRGWAAKNSWFDAEVIPALRLAVQRALS